LPPVALAQSDTTPHPQPFTVQRAPDGALAQSLAERHAVHVWVAGSQWVPPCPIGGPLVQSASTRHPTHAPFAGLQIGSTPKVSPTQSAVVEHLGAQDPALHTCVLSQSAAVVQPQPPSALQKWPFPLPAQLAFVTQPTQTPVDTLQVGPDRLPTQSLFEAHALPHPESPPGTWIEPAPHTVPAGQSAMELQLQTPPWKLATHAVPLAELAQSLADRHPQMFPAGDDAFVMQAEPPGPVAQSAFVTHGTHDPIVASQAEPDGFPTQSALVVQGFSHCPPSGPVWVQAEPAGQSGI